MVTLWSGMADWGPGTAARYDTPGEGAFAPAVLDPMVDRLAALAQGGSALEFAIGTGRVAIPLRARGVPVQGIELSPAMVARLRATADETAIPVTMGDMAHATAPGRYALVYLVYNTISNLLTPEAQVACLRNAARHLDPGGRFVVELWVPDLPPRGQAVPAVVQRADPDYLLIDRFDTATQQVVSIHVTMGPDGPRVDSTPHRYIWPAELDRMAAEAGLALESRHADWVGTEFTAASPSHVSVYRLPA